MFGSIGVSELIMIFIIALLLFGPKQLPNLGRTLGKALGEFKRASNDLQRTLEEEVRAEELRAVSREVREATTVPSVLFPEDQKRGLKGGEPDSSSETQGEKDAQG